MLDDTVRTSFGIMIVQQRSLPTSEGRVRLAETLQMCVETGVFSDNDTEKYKQQRIMAARHFSRVVRAMTVIGRTQYVDALITMHCNEIYRLLMPLIVANGYAIINEASFDLPKRDEKISNNLFGGRK